MEGTTIELYRSSISRSCLRGSSGQDAAILWPKGWDEDGCNQWVGKVSMQREFSSHCSTSQGRWSSIRLCRPPAGAQLE
eukprot:scaffold109416_cov33-Tisochrysis_lutea.AAC.9